MTKFEKEINELLEKLKVELEKAERDDAYSGSRKTPYVEGEIRGVEKSLALFKQTYGGERIERP